MKKVIKKLGILCVLVIIVSSVSVYANEIEENIILPQKSKKYELWEQLPEEERKNTIQPLYSDIKIKDSVKRSTYNNLLRTVKESSDKSKFDLRDKLQEILVKNQQKTGSCWAFSYTSMLETTLANKYNKISKEYSPMHLDYKTAKMYNRKLGEGGTILMEMAYSAGGFGPVYEEELPFDTVYDENKNSSLDYYLSSVNSVSTDQEAKAKIEDMNMIAGINKEYTGSSIIYKSGDTLISNEDVKALREIIKKHIKENGALAALFYSDIGTVAGSDNCVSKENFYNNKTNAFYCDNSSKQANHGVTIIGWDDGYKKENFTEAHRPLNDGAYIVLNSWGKEFGDEGYFYVSYDDAIIENGMVGITSVKEYNDNVKKADYIYQYDELGASEQLSFKNSTAYAANVFTRQDNEIEEHLLEIGIHMLSTQGVEVYVSTDGKLENLGNPVASFTGSNALEAGYHTIKLPSPIKLSKEKFAVIIKYINKESVGIPMEINLKDSNLSFGSTVYDTATSKEGESYISLNGAEWLDLYNLKVGFLYTLKNTNVCIKAFTDKVSNVDTTISVEEVSLNKEKETIEIGETITLMATVLPENATNKKVRWTTSNASVATVNEGTVKGISAGTATITVETEDGKFKDTCIVTVEQKQETPSEIKVESITMNKEAITIKKGETITIGVTVLPSNATNKKVKWTTSNANVATVNNGIVTGVSAGTAIITVETEDGKLKDTCIVTVEEKEEKPTEIKVTKVTLNKEKASMQVGDKMNLVATIYPENAKNKNVTWESSNKNVATITKEGIITAIKEGKTIISVTTEEGKYTAECEITVTKKTNTADDIYSEEDDNKKQEEVNNKTEEKDNTIADKILPNTGTKLMIFMIASILAISIVLYKKCKGYKDIK